MGAPGSSNMWILPNEMADFCLLSCLFFLVYEKINRIARENIQPFPFKRNACATVWYVKAYFTPVRHILGEVLNEFNLLL